MGDTVPADAEVSYLGTLLRTGGGSHQVVCTRELSVAVVGLSGFRVSVGPRVYG